MTAKAIREKALALPVAERLSLVQELWDSIAEQSDDIELSAADKKLLDERVAADRKNPSAAQPWSIVKRRVMTKLKSRRRAS
jgi:putative addiction module component (TIGR02574 family)